MRRWGLAVLLALALLTAVVFLFVRGGGSPPGNLTGRTWQLRTVVDGGTTTVLSDDLDSTLRFDDDGDLHVDFGCNLGGGR